MKSKKRNVGNVYVASNSATANFCIETDRVWRANLKTTPLPAGRRTISTYGCILAPFYSLFLLLTPGLERPVVALFA